MGTRASGVTPFRVPVAELFRRLEGRGRIDLDDGVLGLAGDDGKAERSEGKHFNG